MKNRRNESGRRLLSVAVYKEIAKKVSELGDKEKDKIVDAYWAKKIEEPDFLMVRYS